MIQDLSLAVRGVEPQLRARSRQGVAADSADGIGIGSRTLSCTGVACPARYGRYGKSKQTLIFASRGKGNFCDLSAFPARLKGIDEEE